MCVERSRTPRAHSSCLARAIGPRHARDARQPMHPVLGLAMGLRGALARRPSPRGHAEERTRGAAEPAPTECSSVEVPGLPGSEVGVGADQRQVDRPDAVSARVRTLAELIPDVSSTLGGGRPAGGALQANSLGRRSFPLSQLVDSER